MYSAALSQYLIFKKKSKEMLIYYVDRYISKLITSIYLWNNTVSAIWNFWPPQTSIIKVHFFGLKLILRMLAPQGLEFFACFEYYNFSTPKIYIYIYMTLNRYCWRNAYPVKHFSSIQVKNPNKKNPKSTYILFRILNSV